MNSASLRSLLAVLAAASLTAGAAPVPVTGSMTYSQDFDSLGIAAVAWADDSTLPGWYAQMNNGATPAGDAQVTDGSAALNGLLNCGTTDAADRALGSKATSNAPGFANIAYAVSFQNTTANPVQWTGLTYTGECWRTNTTAAGLAEKFDVFYQISTTPVMDILSGASGAAAVAGAGFTAAGAAGNWTSPVLLPPAPAVTPAAVDGNDAANRTRVTYTPLAGLILQPGQHLMIKWTDSNLGGTDGFQALDDVAVAFTQLEGVVTAEYFQRTRDMNGTPADAADDTFGFTALVSGSGAVSNWTTADVQPPASNASTGTYGTPVEWTGFPIAAKTVNVADAGNPAFAAVLTVQPPLMIGTNEMAGAGMPIYNADAPVTGWAINDGQRTLTQNGVTNPNNATAFAVDSEVVDLATTGHVLFRADLDAIAGTSSGFEATDYFALQLILDGGAPVSALGALDVANNDGRLSGFADAAGVGPELPGNDEPNVTRTFSISYLIPDTVNSLQVRIIGNSNSTAETLTVRNLRLTPPPASIQATLAGGSVLDHRGTVDPADDQFSAPVNVVPIGMAAPAGWTSDATPASGAYSPPAVTFGPFALSEAPKTVVIKDQTDDLISASVVIPAPPLAAIAPLTATDITRVANGPGLADDTVTFQLVITGTSTGPLWSATGVEPASGTYSAAPVLFTIPAPLPGTPLAVTITDQSYPGATQTVSIPFPAIYVLGQKDFGAPEDILSTGVLPPHTGWANDATARTLTMTNGTLPGAGVKTVTSEPVDLSAVAGAVLFTANLHVQDRTGGFEAADTFNAWLIYDGNAGAPVSLITPHDDDASGLMQGAELCPVPAVNPTTQDFDYALSALIPDGVNSVQMVIAGINNSPNETMVVSAVRFAPAPPTTDNDGDGISNADEEIMGTDSENPADALRLTQNAANPLQMDFPTVALRYYRVYQSDDADGQEATHLQTWVDSGLPTIPGDGNPGSFTVTVAPAEVRRYYRLHVMLSDGPWPGTVP
jgi:hypothetical protein